MKCGEHTTVSAEQWAEASKAGLCCGMLGCHAAKKTLKKCRACIHKYCPEHLEFHEKNVPHLPGKESA